MGIWKRNGFWSPGEPVNDGEEICHALAGRQRSNKIDVKTAEPGGRRRALYQWCPSVAMNLGGLTGMILSAPLPNVTFRAVPHETLCDGMLCGAHACVREAVDVVENWASPGFR